MIRLGITRPKARPIKAEIIQIVTLLTKKNSGKRSRTVRLDKMNALRLTDEFKLGFMYDVAMNVVANITAVITPTSVLEKPRRYFDRGPTVVVTMLLVDLAAMVIKERVSAIYAKDGSLLNLIRIIIGVA